MASFSSAQAPLLITSLDNPRVKSVLSLREKRDRDSTGKFLIEGYRELLRAQENGVELEEFFFCPELFLGTNEEALLKKAESKSAKLIACSERVFRKMSYRDRPDGLLAIAKQMKATLSSLEKKVGKQKGRKPLYVVAEAIEKPGNLGTILRSADAAGADGVIVCDRCTDIYNPNVVRASVGTLFTLPVVEESSERVIEWLKSQHVHIVAATPHAKETCYQANLKEALAIVVGTEQLGLSDLWYEHADIKLKIPMLGVADSLNVAMACTILLFETQRQRDVAASTRN